VGDAGLSERVGHASRQRVARARGEVPTDHRVGVEAVRFAPGIEQKSRLNDPDAPPLAALDLVLRVEARRDAADEPLVDACGPCELPFALPLQSAHAAPTSAHARLPASVMNGRTTTGTAVGPSARAASTACLAATATAPRPPSQRTTTNDRPRARSVAWPPGESCPSTS
jgi:hypothetical protein